MKATLWNPVRKIGDKWVSGETEDGGQLIALETAAYRVEQDGCPVGMLMLNGPERAEALSAKIAGRTINVVGRYHSLQ